VAREEVYVFLRLPRVTGWRSSRYGAVSAGVAQRLRQLGADVHYVDSGNGRRLAPMLWRFTVVDDPRASDISLTEM